MLIKKRIFILFILALASLSVTACPLCSRHSSEKQCDDCRKELRFIKDALTDQKEKKKDSSRLLVPKLPGNPAFNLRMRASILNSLSNIGLPVAGNTARVSAAEFAGSACGDISVTPPHWTSPENNEFTSDFLSQLTSEESMQIDQSIIPLLDSLIVCNDFVIANPSWIATLSEGYSMADCESHYFVISYENGTGWFFINFDFATGSFQVLNWSDHFEYQNHNFRQFPNIGELKAWLKSRLTGKSNINSVFF